MHRHLCITGLLRVYVVRFPLLWWNTMTNNSSLGRKGFVWVTLPGHSPWLKKVRAKTCCQELMQRTGRSAAYWRAQPAFPQNPAQGGTSTVSWTPPSHQSLRKCSTHSSTAWSHGSNFSIEAPSSQDYSLGQVDIELTNQHNIHTMNTRQIIALLQSLSL